MQRALLKKRKKSDPWYLAPMPGVGCVFKKRRSGFLFLAYMSWETLPRYFASHWSRGCFS